MRILITNDDGIHAPGLGVLERIAANFSEDVWVVAPETDQSGAAHSLTLNDPLRLRQIGEKTFAVRGTPTDCVIMGVRHLLPEKPDLVLSGVNRGQNIADDVTYSGTIAGAIEGTLLGVRSMALSQAYSWETRGAIKWHTAEALAPALIRSLLDIELDRNVLLNVNFPDREPDEVAGTEMTVQGRRDQDLLYIDPREDGRGNPYFWIAFQRHKSTPAKGTDLCAIVEGRVSVTPLTLDLTDAAAHRTLLSRGT
ncbi:MAG: 5'/3'-nucleotidase SurE [Hyphomicrobiales bacterium]|nr:5'/3'-nucleotidase SurE [Hyphomicrobiales bacterium]